MRTFEHGDIIVRMRDGEEAVFFRIMRHPGVGRGPMNRGLRAWVRLGIRGGGLFATFPEALDMIGDDEAPVWAARYDGTKLVPRLDILRMIQARRRLRSKERGADRVGA